MNGQALYEHCNLHDMRGQHDAADSRLRNSGIIPIRPSIGPGRRSQAVFAPSKGKQIDAMVMEITVIRKKCCSEWRVRCRQYLADRRVPTVLKIVVNPRRR